MLPHTAQLSEILGAQPQDAAEIKAASAEGPKE